MANIYLVPNWFLGYDILLELAFAIVSLIVGIYAFKIYKLSEQQESKLFSIAFFSISVSYFIQSFLNFAIISELNENISILLRINNINTMNNLGIFAHMIFFMAGLITLVYMTLRIRSVKAYSLLFIIIMLSLIFSLNKLYIFYLLSSVLLLYILIHYFKNYFESRKPRMLLVLVAFAFLLFGTIHFIFSLNHGLYYVIGHFLELIAYLLILTNLILVIRK